MHAENTAEKLDLLKPKVVPFFDDDSNTFTYVVQDPTSKACAIIDSVLDFDMATGRTSHRGADAVVSYVKENDLEVEWIIDTHVHADHLTAAPYLKENLGGKIAISEHVTTVQETFRNIFNCGDEFQCDGSQFDHLFKDDERYTVGNMGALVIHTPGHTPACMTHVIGDAAFVGDTLFMPDSGTARTDFPGGSAATLYQSINSILSLPPQTRVFMCHDYGSDERSEVEYLTSVAEELQNNIHINAEVEESEFVQLREKRNSSLAAPHLILPSLQVNMRAGQFPPAEDNDIVYLKIPVDVLGSSK